MKVFDDHYDSIKDFYLGKPHKTQKCIILNSNEISKKDL